ncbi:MAG: SDR family oxidoreductase [Deltaproteobacteria bacterium]|nr:SDR family oxidoreductase [Deltaproteobacteria bacterium]
MKILFIGGTGNISSASTRLALEKGYDVTLINRGKNSIINQCENFTADINDLDTVTEFLKNRHFDAVVNWVAFHPDDIKRDIELFKNHADQYIFISSASAYEKPPQSPYITEETPLVNPFWDYSQNKIACENMLTADEVKSHFNVTIVRPSLTYDTLFPVAIGGWGCYTLADRMLKGKPIIVHGDGTSLWTITHSDDFARGFVPLLGNPKAFNNQFHITSDELLTWNQIYDQMAAALNTEAVKVHIPSTVIAKLNPQMGPGLLGDKAHSAIFDNTRIKETVKDFKAIIPFKEGIIRTARWFDKNPHKKIVDESVNNQMDKLISKYNSLNMI